jgi:hypothetical protein
MKAAQCRQRPRSTIHATIGTLSHGRTNVPQAAQCEGGETIETPRGTRSITTDTNDPSTAPMTTQVASAITAASV